MQITEHIHIGMSKEISFQVEEQFTAQHVGSGSLRVLATPSMIAFMERAARDLLAENLPPGYSSVGVRVDVRHLAPTAAGQAVRLRCEILDIDGRRVTFGVEAWDAHEKVGEGQHQRFIIDVARFLERVEAKQQA